MPDLTYLEAVVVEAFQGISEPFPISSLGHSILILALVGGSWSRGLDMSAPDSPYFAFLVALHVATAAALLVHFRRDWIAICKGFVSSLRDRSIARPEQRLAWLLLFATIPVGVVGLLLDHAFRTLLGRPTPAALFLVANGAVLLAGNACAGTQPPPLLIPTFSPTASPAPASMPMVAPEVGPRWVSLPGRPLPDLAHFYCGSLQPLGAVPPPEARSFGAGNGLTPADRRLAALGFGRGVLIGSAQVLALRPGISRSGATMVAGLARGLNYEDAARLSFLLATPVILAAGLFKVPELTGPATAGLHGQVAAGSLASFVSALLAVRFLERWFRTRTLTPFAVYSIGFGVTSLIVLGAR